MRDEDNSLIIPNHDLVYLLVKCGRTEEAIKLTESIILKLEEDIRNLKLPMPNWAWDSQYSQKEIYASFLISRLGLPVPSIKWLVSQKIAEQLSKQNNFVEQKLLADLALKKQESECIEILCIFFMALDLGYVAKYEVGEYINARSILSDMMVKIILPSSRNFGNYSTDLTTLFSIPAGNHQFDKIMGTEVPLLYKNNLERKEKMTGLPLVSLYRAMWSKTFEYAPSNNDGSIDYFYHTDGGNSTGLFYTNNSHRGRSAFLRTLEFAQQFMGMAITDAEKLSIIVLPVEPAFAKLKPQKPIWLPNWEYKTDVSKENINSFIIQCLAGLKAYYPAEILGALSFPIKLEQDFWIDLNIIRCIQYSSELSGLPTLDRSYGFSCADKLNRTIRFYGNAERLAACESYKPLVGPVYPRSHSRYGHWHTDIEERGVSVPLLESDNKYVEAVGTEQKIQFTLNGDNIGECGFWFIEWSPIHPKGINSLCGTGSVEEPPELPNLFLN